MAELKTTANDASVDKFIATLTDSQQREDSKKLLEVFGKVTGKPPVMWGDAIIGFGTVSLTYSTGRKVDWLEVGFSPRKGKISLYVTFDATKLTGRFPNLGKYKTGKGCIYITRLADVDLKELEKLIKTAYDTGYEQPKRDDGREQATKIEKH